MRVVQFSVIAGLLVAGCFDGSPTFPEPGSVELESTPLLSGGRGVLVAEAFARLELETRQDESGAVIPRRWANFRVDIGGSETDSWRIDSTRIGFRIPRTATGTLAIDAGGGPIAGASFSARVLGSSFLGRLNEPCRSTGIPRLIPIGQEIIWSGTSCPLTFGPDEWVNGYASIKPAVPGPAMTFIPGAHELATRDSTPTSAGTSYDPSRTILELAGTFGTGTETWIWTMGADPEPVEPIACLPAGSWPGAALAEVAPGVCLAFERGSGRLRRNGSVIDECCELGYLGPSFRVSSAGIAILKDLVIRGGHWPVLDASGHVIHRIEDYEIVTGAAFSLDGSNLYVVATLAGTDDWVLDRWDGTVTNLLDRIFLESSGMSAGGLAVDQTHLYLSRMVVVDDDKHLRVERWHRATLTLDRAVAMGPAPSPYGESTGIQIEILPESGGQRAHMVGWFEDDLGVFGYTVDFE